MRDLLFWVIVIGLVVLGLFLYFKFFKLIKLKSILFVDGSLGSGKSFLSVAIAVRVYKRNKRRYYVKRFFLRVLEPFFPKLKGKWKTLEEPILYSSILLRHIGFVKITRDLLFRKNYRFAYGSVVLLDEFSLIADQMTFKDRELNERLSLFFKLFRHECRGNGCLLVINSQSVQDTHYSLRYVLSDYLYVHHKTRFPFVSALKVQEMAYCGDKNGNQILNVRNEDIEETCKTMLIFNKYHKYYDSVCYSVFTDMLPVYRKIEHRTKDDDLKDTVLVSFKEYQYLTENLKEK